MDRQIVYPGQILPETSLLQMAKDSMIGLAKLSAAVLGTSTMANGFAVTPTGPASLQVVCAPGEIYGLTSIDALAFSTLPADTAHSIMKQGILLDGVTLSCPAPGTSGKSINYLVQATYQDSDSAPVLLPYYNSANPALPYSGMGNNGLTQNTSRKGAAIVAVKAGASANTGSQVTPAPDAGYIGLYVVTVAFGQTTITSTSISQYSGAPLLPSGILQSIQNGNTSSAVDTGTANTYVCAFTPAITARSEQQPLRFKVKTSNTGASTFNDGLGAVALVGGAHSALQGGELVANGDAWVQWNTSIGGGSYILLFCTGAAEQVAPATQSQHATQLGQVQALPSSLQSITASVASSALTLTWAAQPLVFRNATLANGAPVSATPAGTLSLVVPAGATLGTTSGKAAQLVLLVAYNAGTPVLCVGNIAGDLDLSEAGVITPTTISAGATLASTIYSASAVAAGSPYRVLGYIQITEAAAGTWATAPTLVQGAGGQASASFLARKGLSGTAYTSSTPAANAAFSLTVTAGSFVAPCNGVVFASHATNSPAQPASISSGVTISGSISGSAAATDIGYSTTVNCVSLAVVQGETVTVTGATSGSATNVAWVSLGRNAGFMFIPAN
ncbi:hypothetical protein HK44_020735 [Pseudomonas fluorescens HK44]|uniref:Uncharacterized protein n=1 Tax=Pseudomonas fluorescens HK44 TaxID=1042209 RepID=A0A010SYN7_PSEFL|nr:hypothetical protein [Pseudomonas fluorescens]EXF95813.1 hypothetical protein HK44_020735 [Pseudomonas fluorescens HK44]